jgi:hypothetical protein
MAHASILHFARRLLAPGADALLRCVLSWSWRPLPQQPIYNDNPQGLYVNSWAKFHRNSQQSLRHRARLQTRRAQRKLPDKALGVCAFVFAPPKYPFAPGFCVPSRIVPFLLVILSLGWSQILSWIISIQNSQLFTSGNIPGQTIKLQISDLSNKISSWDFDKDLCNC